MAMSLNNLAELLRVQGKYDEALPLFQRALAIAKMQLIGRESMAITNSDSDSDECLEVLDNAAVLLDCTLVFCAECQRDLSRHGPSSRLTIDTGAIIECPICRKRARMFTEIAL